jgi:ABC-2 type transport system ATP-binding protein
MTTTAPPSARPGGGAVGQVAPPDVAIEVRDLVKRYPKRPTNAVDGVSFTVPAGEVFGLLGPNGAGKTTTIGVLTTRVAPTAGTAVVAGVDVVADPVGARARFAVVSQRNNLDRSLTVRQNLVYHAAYHRVPAAERGRRADLLLAQFGLADRPDDLVDRLSGGQAQRVMIARALMHDPDVLFLDEPTTGLDPQARLFVWDRVRELRDDGVTVLITTHDMDEAATLADRVGIVDHGRLLALDTPAALTRTLPGSSTLELDIGLPPDPDGPGGAGLDGMVDDLGRLDQVERVTTAPSGGSAVAGSAGAGSAGAAEPGGGTAPAEHRVRVKVYLAVDASLLLAPVAAAVVARGGRLHDITFGRPSLEDVFIHLTGRGLR